MPPQQKVFFLRALKAEGVGAEVHYTPLHLNSYYQQRGFARESFPGSTEVFNSLIRLPLYPGMTLEQQKQVVWALEKINRYLEEGSPHGH